jgi:hypothetical protein
MAEKMTEYKGYGYNITSAKVREGPRGCIFSVWRRDGDTVIEVHLDNQQFPSEREAEIAARKWIDTHPAGS